MTRQQFQAGAGQDGPGAYPNGAPDEHATPQRLRAVIVDDELMAAWLIESLLEDLGYEVAAIFASGEAALSSREAKAAQLVIMDINLGKGIDGIGAAAELRRIGNVAIVFCSAYSDKETRQRAADAVPNASFASKPLTKADLQAAIEMAVQVRH